MKYADDLVLMVKRCYGVIDKLIEINSEKQDITDEILNIFRRIIIPT